MGYVRWESPLPNDRGAHTGIFGLANGLARSGSLSEPDLLWWQRSNAWFDAAYPDPGTVDGTLFDKSVVPVTSCWFARSASHLIERVGGYLQLLDRYGVGWRELRSSDPGVVLYRDEVQIVVRPHENERHDRR